METGAKWDTPFIRQWFMTTGQALAMAQFGLINGFSSSFLPQLRRPGSVILISDVEGSWIASTPSIVIIITTVITPALMGKCGRKAASIISVVPLIISWLLITTATNFITIIFARVLQGFSLTIIICVTPICIGECTSPKNRGSFLTCLSLSLAMGTFSAHTLGAYVAWKIESLAFAVVSFMNLAIVLYTPESPSWLVDKGRYEEAKKSFRWLRGNLEDDELKGMIEAHILLTESKKNTNFAKSKSITKKIKSFLNNCKTTVRKPEFYKPIFIGLHLYTIVQFTGLHVLASYAEDIFGIIIGDDIDVNAVIISTDGQRIVSSLLGMLVIRRFRRKNILTYAVIANVLAYLAISLYTYGVAKGFFLRRPFVGGFLMHALLFSIATGTLPLPLIISGEIFPLEYRSLSSVICTALVAPITFAMLKSVPYLISTIGLHGMFFLYTVALLYCLIMSLKFLPETKDRTLQDIEDEFRGKPRQVAECSQSLTEKDNH